MYQEPTEEVIKQIQGMFGGYGGQSPDFKFQTRDDGYYIDVSQMYDYVRFTGDLSTLQAYMQIASLLGVENGDERDRWSYGGCETCDYGSKYTVELRFW